MNKQIDCRDYEGVACECFFAANVTFCIANDCSLKKGGSEVCAVKNSCYQLYLQDPLNIDSTQAKQNYNTDSQICSGSTKTEEKWSLTCGLISKSSSTLPELVT